MSLTFLFLTASRFSSSCRSIFFRFCFFSRWRAVSTDSLAFFLFLLRWKKQEMVKTRKKKKNQDKNKKKQNGQSTFFALSLVSSVSVSSSVRRCCPRKRCCSPCLRRQGRQRRRLALGRPRHPCWLVTFLGSEADACSTVMHKQINTVDQNFAYVDMHE